MGASRSSRTSNQTTNQTDRRIAATDQAIVVAEGSHATFRDVSDAVAQEAIGGTVDFGKAAIGGTVDFGKAALKSSEATSVAAYDAWSDIVDRALGTVDASSETAARQVSDVVDTSYTLVESANDRAFNAVKSEASQGVDNVVNLLMVGVVALAAVYVLRG